jgi:hypothetical protein
MSIRYRYEYEYGYGYTQPSQPTTTTSAPSPTPETTTTTPTTSTTTTTSTSRPPDYYVSPTTTTQTTSAPSPTTTTSAPAPSPTPTTTTTTANFSVDFELRKTYTEVEDPYPYRQYYPSLAFNVRAWVSGSPNSMVKFRLYVNGRIVDESAWTYGETTLGVRDGALQLGSNTITVEAENQFGQKVSRSKTVTVDRHPGLKPQISGTLPNITVSWTKTIGPYYVAVSWTASGQGGVLYENRRTYSTSVTIDVRQDRGLWSAIQAGTEGSIYAVVRDRWSQETSNFFAFNQRQRMTHVGVYLSMDPMGAGVVTISYSGASSSISSYSQNYMVPYGERVTVAAKANSGYRFVKWRIGGSETTQNPYSFTADRDMTVVAIFEPITTSTTTVSTGTQTTTTQPTTGTQTTTAQPTTGTQTTQTTTTAGVPPRYQYEYGYGYTPPSQPSEYYTPPPSTLGTTAPTTTTTGSIRERYEYEYGPSSGYPYTPTAPSQTAPTTQTTRTTAPTTTTATTTQQQIQDAFSKIWEILNTQVAGIPLWIILLILVFLLVLLR